MCANEHDVGGSDEAATARALRDPRAAAVRAISIAVAAALVAAAGPARAACNFTAPVTIDFGPVRPGVGASATATLSYRCTGLNLFASIAITPTARAMTSGGQTLAFELYTDAGHTTVFPGSPAMLVAATSGTVTVYGYVGPQDAMPGTYAGAFVATITSWFIGSQTRTTALNAAATVTGDCTIQPATLAFGAYDPLGAGREATATITLACTPGTVYSVGLSAGVHADGATRRMAGPAGDLLQYELFSDPGRQSPWTDAPVARVGGTAATSAPIPLVVYGRIPPGQMVQAGDYSDVVQSTVNF